MEKKKINIFVSIDLNQDFNYSNIWPLETFEVSSDLVSVFELFQNLKNEGGIRS